MSKKTIHWGILGCGRIAKKFAADLQLVKGTELTAVASRDLDNAKSFAKEFNARQAVGNYDELVNNPDIDAIYIATPHSHHKEHTLLCLKHNKAVLCEKPFAINAFQAREMIAFAKERKVFLMEGLWTKFLPHYQKMQEIIQEGELGDLKSVLVNFGFRLRPDAPVRLSDPQLGGGSLLDIGVYNIFIILSVLGRPDSIQATMSATANGIDEQCAVQFHYGNGALAQSFTSFTTHLPTEVLINGTKGYLKMTSKFYESSSKLELYHGIGGKSHSIKFKKQKGIGFRHEAKHVSDCLRKGLLESPIMTHDNSIQLMETLDEIRKLIGLRYPGEPYAIDN